MFCPQCGREVCDNAAVCVGCGMSLANVSKKGEGKVSAGWWWLGFLIPLAGLLVWIFCHDTEPIKAKKAGIGAIIGTVVSVVLAVLLTLLPVLLFIFMETTYYY